MLRLGKNFCAGRKIEDNTINTPDNLEGIQLTMSSNFADPLPRS